MKGNSPGPAGAAWSQGTAEQPSIDRPTRTWKSRFYGVIAIGTAASTCVCHRDAIPAAGFVCRDTCTALVISLQGSRNRGWPEPAPRPALVAPAHESHMAASKSTCIAKGSGVSGCSTAWASRRRASWGTQDAGAEGSYLGRWRGRGKDMRGKTKHADQARKHQVAKGWNGV